MTTMTASEAAAEVARFADLFSRHRPGRLIVKGPGDSSTGYGQMIARLLDGLAESGIETSFVPLFRDDTRRPLEAALASRLAIDADVACLVMSGPWTVAPAGSVILTMWEATLLADDFVANLNRYRCVVVPCEDNARWFRDSGVRSPIRVVPLGIDPALHHPAGRPEAPGFKVGAAGRVGEWPGNRKGLDIVASAFLKAFPDPHPATLEIKTYRDCKIQIPPHPRITLVQDALSDEELADWYRSLDVFVSASKGEGWGLQPHQAMGCGTPVIAPFWGGHAAYMTEASGWPVEFAERIAFNPYFTGRAKWCEVNLDSLVDRMRQAYAEPEIRAAKGRAAAARAAEFTWTRSGRELAAVVREFALAPSSQPPGLATQAGTFARAAVRHVLDGGRHAPEEVQEARRAICRACPMLDESRDTCNACGCRLALKQAWASQACPRSHWPAV